MPKMGQPQMDDRLLNIVVAPMLGHNDHAHGEGIYNSCSGTAIAPLNTGLGCGQSVFCHQRDLHRQRSAGRVVIGRVNHVHFSAAPQQAEFCTTNSGVTTVATGDVDGGLDITNVNHGSFIGLYPVNLTNITGLTFRVDSPG